MEKITKRKSNGRSTEQKKKKGKCKSIFTLCENSHCAKISHRAKILQVRKPTKFLHPSAKLLDFPAFSALLSFWFLIYNADFDSNSTCLDRLDNLGIINLQKTIKLATKCD